MNPTAILDFWFGPLEDGLCSSDRRTALFRADDALDAEIAERFADDVEQALSGALDALGDSTEGRMALVILLDQFTRNLFRGTPKAFAGDARALAHAQAAVAAGQDRALPIEMRVFLYLPFEHAEDPVAQEACVAHLTALLDAQPAGSEQARVVADYLHHAREHQALIERFGRFPHRNRILGRADTPEERLHLDRDGRSFGQG